MKLLALIFLLLPAVCFGGKEVLNPDYVDDAAPWEELAASLPPYPKNENLVSLVVPSSTGNHFMIDTASLFIGKDGVVRYTVVIESQRGARTVSYEGLRCDTVERKIYAFGQPDGKWTENKRAAWEGIKMRTTNAYQKVLFEGLFCEVGIPIWNVEEGVRNLRNAAGIR